MLLHILLRILDFRRRFYWMSRRREQQVVEAVIAEINAELERRQPGA